MRSQQTQHTTRLAPSPTGALHLGNARTFLVNWAIARRNGWRVVLRIEDLDQQRVRDGVIESTIDTLHWLGLDWEGDPCIQSRSQDRHAAAMRSLAQRALVYPCALSRREIEEAMSAPHAGDGESRFPAELRPPLEPREFDDRETNWRFATPPGAVRFTDSIAGAQSIDPTQSVGDFVVWTKRGHASYQLAVVVDDHAQGVTQVVRGDDLLDSTARQIHLIRALNLDPQPEYTHLPLVAGPDGRRLAKRHGDTRLDAYRELGTPPERVIGLLAAWCGTVSEPTPMSAREFADAFDPDNIPRAQIAFQEEHDAWLRSGS